MIATERRDTWRQHKTASVTNSCKVRNHHNSYNKLEKHEKTKLTYTVFLWKIKGSLYTFTVIAHLGYLAKETVFPGDLPAAAYAP